MTRLQVLWLVPGAAAVAFAAALAATLADTNLHTEGSPAGTIVFVVMGSAILLAALVGLGLTARGAAAIGAGPASAVGAFAAIVAFATASGLQASGVRLWGPEGGPSARVAERRTLPHAELAVSRTVEVTGTYALGWKARDEVKALSVRLPVAAAPALELRIPIADLRAGTGAAIAIGETADGPRGIELPLFAVAEGPATLRLHRDESSLSDEILVGLQAPVARASEVPPYLWAASTQGSWSLLGFDCSKGGRERVEAGDPGEGRLPGCHVPEGRLARLLPAHFGPARLRLDAREANGHCLLTFAWRGRPATVQAPGRCFAKPSLRALAAAAALLDRLVADTAHAPLAPERLARAQSATQRCVQEPGADAGWRKVRCRHAVELAAAELEASPGLATPLILQVLESGPAPAHGEREALVSLALKGLEASGRAEGRDAVALHTLRLEDPANERGVRAAALDRVMRLAPAVLEPADPLFARAQAAALRVAVHPLEEPRRVAMLAGMDAKAMAAMPGSQTAIVTRYALCSQRMFGAIERETLRECADTLMAAWQSGVGGAAGFAAYGGEPELAIRIGRMYASWALLSPSNAAAGAEGLRRARRAAEERFAGRPEAGRVRAAYADIEALLRRPAS